MRIIIAAIAILFVAADWRVWPKGKLCEITYEHQFLPERDTLLVRHYHKVNEKYYILPLDGGELWADNVKEL